MIFNLLFTHAAYRIFWYYGPNKEEITILAITEHP